MEEADLAEVVSLAKQLGYPVSIEDIRSRFGGISTNPDYSLFVAKTETNKVVGWIQINKEPKSLLVSDYADVAALVVDDKHRGHGIGRLLLQEAEKWAKRNGVKLIRIRSNAKRTEAHRFYNREGYEVAKLSNIFTKSCE